MEYQNITPLDMQRIEMEARRMRAEAVRSMFAALGRLIARAVPGVFASRGTGRPA